MNTKSGKCNRTDKPKETSASHVRRKFNFKTNPKDMHPVGETNQNENSPVTKRKFGGYRKAYAEFEKINTQKNQQREQALKRKKEIKESLEKYKQKKREKNKKLSAKTKKGQPIMKNRIELLLEKIQSSKF